MKSTYKLFGALWDGMEEKIQPAIYEPTMLSSKATVSLKALLCAYTESEIIRILEPISGLEAVCIDMDYIYSNQNPVIKSFIEKRMRQIISYLALRFKAVYYYENSDKKNPIRCYQRLTG